MAKHILGSTLAFIAGMLIAILLLVVGIGAATFFIATATTVDKAETMIGVNATIKVAIFTLAANATGKTPKPALLGPSKPVVKPVR